MPNTLAFTYVLTSFVMGIALVINTSWIGFFSGTLLLAHGMVIAAYLIHECAHNTLFANNSWHKPVGEFLMWLTGACYGEYEGIRKKHFRHHVDRADVINYDYRRILKRSRLLRGLVYTLEFLYIPAVDLLMHAMVLMMPFILESRKHLRKRVIKVFVIRISLFTVGVWFDPLVVSAYIIAYMLFLHVLRFMDAFQHTYEIVEVADEEKLSREGRDSVYENHHTFSNLISRRWPWLNLLVLNFCYHNAHHVKPVEPWYRLPDIHRQLSPELQKQIVPLSQQLRDYHGHRMQRVLNERGLVVVPQEEGTSYVGANAVSFLTAH